MKTQMETELARAELATPCRKALESLGEHSAGLTRFVDDPGSRWTITPRSGAPGARRWPEELLRLGGGLEWPADGGGVLDLGHVVAMGAQSPEMADVVLRALCGGRGPGSGGRPIVLTMEVERTKRRNWGNQPSLKALTVPRSTGCCIPTPTFSATMALVCQADLAGLGRVPTPRYEVHPSTSPSCSDMGIVL